MVEADILPPRVKRGSRSAAASLTGFCGFTKTSSSTVESGNHFVPSGKLIAPASETSARPKVSGRHHAQILRHQGIPAGYQCINDWNPLAVGSVGEA